mmetsp:Transcript_29432/g.57611  ORF Transcript_29432/g.57611 Transcript_29432/m.57611 type:complete len:279 (+) Transcript_29432:2180-3016(+)
MPQGGPCPVGGGLCGHCARDENEWWRGQGGPWGRKRCGGRGWLPEPGPPHREPQILWRAGRCRDQPFCHRHRCRNSGGQRLCGQPRGRGHPVAALGIGLRRVSRSGDPGGRNCRCGRSELCADLPRRDEPCRQGSGHREEDLPGRRSGDGSKDPRPVADLGRTRLWPFAGLHGQDPVFILDRSGAARCAHRLYCACARGAPVCRRGFCRCCLRRDHDDAGLAPRPVCRKHPAECRRPDRRSVLDPRYPPKTSAAPSQLRQGVATLLTRGLTPSSVPHG